MRLKSLLTVGFLLFAAPLSATHGFYPFGDGIKQMGIAGAVVAYPQDSMVLATNPAGIGQMCNRWDVGLRVFSPIRRYSYTGTEGQIPPGGAKSGWHYFPIPTLGAVWRINRCWTTGFALYANGGLNTSYRSNNPVFAGGSRGGLGVDYAQLTFAPSICYNIARCQWIGVAPLIGVQRLKAWGLHGFTSSSVFPEHVTDNGYAYAGGGGFRVGWMGKLHPCVTLGASYTSKIWMNSLNKYKGLLADFGKLDVGGNFSAGFAIALLPCLDIAFEFRRLFFDQVTPVNNPVQNLFAGNRLGEVNGPGFGWEDSSVWRIGAEYRLNWCWSFRAGYSYGDIPYPPSQVDFNIIAPAVVRSHLGAGLTYSGCWGELSLVYAHAFNAHRTGQSFFGLGTITESMYQNSIGVGFGRGF